MAAGVAAAVIAVAGLAASALGQLTPSQTYFGINRPIAVTVAVPEKATGEAKIELFAFGSEAPAASAPVIAGNVNLATLFPDLWTTQSPKVMYAQLVVGEERIGAPLVLQPLTPPKMASVGPDGRSVQFRAERGSASSGLRVYVDQHVVVETSMGEMEFRLRPDQAPNTVWNFRELVRGGFYTDIIFHRIVPRLQNGAPFVIQVGDPTGTGSGGPGFNIDLEDSKLPHDFGVLSMARTQDPNTNGSQIFVCLSREGTEFLDGNYCAFGQAVRGADVIVAISGVELADERSGRPKEPPRIISARLVDAPPFGKGPAVVTRPQAAPTPR
jgi:peptidyl-prolyl cis-trans isomerase B (cyclophilin B)